MISILIPVYHHPVHELIFSLHEQCKEAGIHHEIIIGNDSSDYQLDIDSNWLDSQPEIRIVNHQTSLGRSGNRNFLAKQASNPWLLFIDGDAGMASEYYMEEYVKHIHEGHTVICGGTLYRSKSPLDRKQRLRWLYGKQREQIPAVKRNYQPWNSFSSFNFLISRDLFLNEGFNERIDNYGHEDTLFGFRLKEKRIAIQHIDNGLYHDGLDTNDVFLEKTREAVISLVSLYHTGIINEWMAKEIALLNLGIRLRHSGMVKIAGGVLSVLRPIIRIHLRSRFPNIRVMDMYKLDILISIL